MSDTVIWAFMKREDWGAADPTERPTPHAPTRIVVHHSWLPNTKGFRGGDSIASIQRYHQRQKGWADIAYHFLISPDGKYVYQGRDPKAVGAHCGGTPPHGVRRIFGNTGSIGICLIGDYDTETVDPHGLTTLQNFIEGLKVEFGIPAGQVFGHFEAWDAPPKTCPGKNVATALGWRDRWNHTFPDNPIR